MATARAASSPFTPAFEWSCPHVLSAAIAMRWASLNPMTQGEVFAVEAMMMAC